MMTCSLSDDVKPDVALVISAVSVALVMFLGHTQATGSRNTARPRPACSRLT